ncbi:hypothetical protein L6452_25075 [Arctium lappa]|uniref:Uncharacterized protein n=1 Tax=Arctium lappa TaxID=4217 RepID=A0ACB9AAT3_ARCLA|nr:hypothetical protein L6452_25075 [Arctium lappa]
MSSMSCSFSLSQKALVDNRITNTKDSILGAARGNLAYGKFMFTVYPNYGISLQTKKINEAFSFIHQFERTDLMKKGDHVFTVTYLVGYALSNSHHSIDYKHSQTIELEDVFQEVGSVTQNRFSTITKDDNDWVLDVSKGKTLYGKEPSLKITQGINTPRASTSTSKEGEDLDTLINLTRAMYKRVDNSLDLMKRLADE